MNILAFAASLRHDSHNKRLISLAADIAREHGATVDLADFSEFDMPLYNHDIQEVEGFPPGAQEMIRRIEAADGLMIASPEYNYSMPGHLKNAIDWVSRARPVPLRGKSGMLLAASTGMVGGIRGLWQLRIPLEGLGVFLHPDMYTLPHSGTAFDENGQLVEPSRMERLEKMVIGYLRTAERLAEVSV